MPGAEAGGAEEPQQLRSGFTERVLAVDLFIFDITSRVHGDGGDIIGVEFPLDLAGSAHDKAAGRDDGALRDEGAGGNDGVGADDRAIENGGAHADEDVGFNGASMEHDGVADGDIVADDERILVLHHVEDAAVLYVGARTNADVVDVAPDDAEGPDAGVFAERDVADHDRSGVDIGGCRNLGPLAPIRANIRFAHNGHSKPRVSYCREIAYGNEQKAPSPADDSRYHPVWPVTRKAGKLRGERMDEGATGGDTAWMETKCARCGAAMRCEPEGACWCFELPRVPMPKPGKATGCLCRECLMERIAAGGDADETVKGIDPPKEKRSERA